MAYLIAVFPYQRFDRKGRFAVWRLDEALRPVKGPVTLGVGLKLLTDDAGVCFGDSVELVGGESVRAGEQALTIPESTEVGRAEGLRVVLYHDRPVYGPGGGLRFRIVALSGGAPLSGTQATVRLELEDGRIVGGRTVVTSRFGTASGQIPVPSNLTPQTAVLTLELSGGQWRAPVLIQAHRPALLLPEPLDLPVRLQPEAPAPTWTVGCRYAFGQPVGQGELRVLIQGGAERWEDSCPVSGEYVEVTVPEACWGELLAGAAADDAPLCVTLTLLDRHGRRGVWGRQIAVGYGPPGLVLELDAEQADPGGRVTGRVLARDAEAPELALELDGQPLASGCLNLAGSWEFAFRAPDEPGEYVLCVIGDGVTLGTEQLQVVADRPLILELSPDGSVTARLADAVAMRSDLLVVASDVAGQLCAATTLVWSNQDVASGNVELPGAGSYLLTGMTLLQSAEEDQPRLLTAGAQVRCPVLDPPTISLEGLPEEAEPGTVLTVRAMVSGAEDWQMGGWLFDRGLSGFGDPLPDPLPDALGGQARALTAEDRMAVWPVCCRTFGIRQEDVALPPFGDPDGPIVGGNLGRCDSDEVQLDLCYEPDDLELEIAGDSEEEGEPVVRIVGGASWWEPALESDSDPLVLRVPLPGQITTHELRLSLSDARGGQAEIRPSVRATRDLFVQGDLPEQAILGDRIEVCCTVHNRGDALLQGVLELTAGDGLSLHGSAEQAIEVSACSSAQRRWVIEAVACGRHAVCFTLQGRDAEELVLDVIPPGSPVRTQVEVMPGRPLVVPSEADDHQVCASLHVALPSLAPFAQLVAWSRYRHGCSEQTASRVETAARVLGYADRHGLRLAGREATETMIDQGVGTLLAWQGPKGWSWYGEGEDPYLSSLVLRGLVAARQVGRDVPESAIRQGLVGLFRTRSSWHEADGFGYGLPEELLLAEVLGALQAVQSVLPNRRVEDAVDELMEQLTRQMMEDPPSDPYLLSIAVQPVAEAHPEMVQLAAGMVLTDWRAEGHPRFAGPGGQDEALAAASRVLRISGLAVPPEWARQLSRPSPDDLFNTRGLAMRTRALVELEPDSTFEGRLTIRVGNQCVRETQLDRDSHTSAALDLAWVDLSGHLVPGVEVSVDLEPAELEGLQVHLECARWPASGAAMEQLSRHLSHQTATVGQGVEVTLELDGELPDWSVLREPLPSNTRVDRESLDALVAAGQICSWSQVAGALQLYFESPPSRLTYGLIADRVGVCSQPGPLLAPMYGSASATLQGAATCLRVT